MADYDSLQLIWGPMAGHALNSWYTSTINLNDADNALALIFCAPKDGTIDRVGLYISLLTGNPPAYNLGITGVTVGGVPNQVAAGGSAIESYDFVATGWHWVTLTTPAVVNAGDILAAHIFPGATAPDAGNYVRVRQSILSWKNSRLPRVCNWIAAAWTTEEMPFGMAARYSDGEVVAPGYDTETFTVSMDTGTTPDEIGCRFQIPFDCICIGASIALKATGGAGSDFTVKLYTDAGGLLKSIDIDVSQAINSLDGEAALVYWDPQTLLADTWYRLTILPTTLNNVDLAQLEVNEADSRYWFCEGERWYKCERTDAGAFTDDDTAIVMMGLILSQITVGNGAGAGGGSYGMIIG